MESFYNSQGSGSSQKAAGHFTRSRGRGGSLTGRGSPSVPAAAARNNPSGGRGGRRSSETSQFQDGDPSLPNHGRTQGDAPLPSQEHDAAQDNVPPHGVGGAAADAAPQPQQAAPQPQQAAPQPQQAAPQPQQAAPQPQQADPQPQQADPQPQQAAPHVVDDPIYPIPGVVYDPSSLDVLMAPFAPGGEHAAAVRASPLMHRGTFVKASEVEPGVVVGTISLINGEFRVHCAYQAVGDNGFVFGHRFFNAADDPAFGGLIFNEASCLAYVLNSLTARNVAQAVHLRTPNLWVPQVAHVSSAVRAASVLPRAQTLAAHPVLPTFNVSATNPPKEEQVRDLNILRMNTHCNASYSDGSLNTAKKMSSDLWRWIQARVPLAHKNNALVQNDDIFRCMVLWKFGKTYQPKDKESPAITLAQIMGPDHFPTFRKFKTQFMEFPVLLDAIFHTGKMWSEFFEDIFATIVALVADKSSEAEALLGAYIPSVMQDILQELSTNIHLTWSAMDVAGQDAAFDGFMAKYIADNDIKRAYDRTVKQPVLQQKRSNSPPSGGGGGRGNGKKARSTGKAGATGGATSPGKPPCVFHALHAAGDAQSGPCTRANCDFPHTGFATYSRSAAIQGFKHYVTNKRYPRKAESASLLALLKAWVNGPAGFGLP